MCMNYDDCIILHIFHRRKNRASITREKCQIYFSIFTTNTFSHIQIIRERRWILSILYYFYNII